MAVITTPLTNTQIKNQKPGPKDIVLSDGGGLQLRVRTNGSKLWNYNYYHPVTKKRVNIGIGPYPDIPLAKAREIALEYRQLVACGVDPKSKREQESLKLKQEVLYTLKNVAAEWLEIKKSEVTKSHAAKTWSSLESHVFPELGDTPLNKITAPLVIKVFRPIEAKGSLETIKRLSQRLNEIMNFGVNCGYIDSNPLVGIRAAFKKPKKESMATLTPSELPLLMRHLSQASIKRVTRCLIEWQLHTMTRPSEAATARWDELDLDNLTWTIPAEKMKRRREHVIPLTQQMLGILDAIKPISGHRDYIFPADRDPKSHCNTQTANVALKRMGLKGKLVSHGMRALASTTLNEQGFESDLIEAALSHVDANQVRAAYNRSDFLERRRPMMSWWSKHIEEASQGNLSVSCRRVS
ncbi:integrase domain-containing protein [Shewanella loihica]|uniref:Phage integrase family protein n=1 Tax=Shewanella loihica (strain ATCC BAA-1088 / PV-4) TaxID=323850 RepID=A3QCD9_SHELP|nr:integrase domain-containing protein [Shewanella loihica]ABO23137.1 phage integrase family protein [Shewanella loihica PV-4]